MVKGNRFAQLRRRRGAENKIMEPPDEEMEKVRNKEKSDTKELEAREEASRIPEQTEEVRSQMLILQEARKEDIPMEPFREEYEQELEQLFAQEKRTNQPMRHGMETTMQTLRSPPKKRQRTILEFTGRFSKDNVGDAKCDPDGKKRDVGQKKGITD